MNRRQGVFALCRLNHKEAGDPMTVTFTQLRFPIEIQYDNMAEVFRILQDLKATGTGNVINAEVQLHITGSNADVVIGLLAELERQNVFSNYKRNELVNQIEAFKRLYLK